MTWLEVTIVLREAPEDWSNLVSILHDLGCPNSRIEDAPPQIIGCFPDLPGVNMAIGELRSQVEPWGLDDLRISPIADEDWIETFRAHFKRREIGASLLIVPTWDEDPIPAGRIALVLDPGQAFGTGDHPTTQMCLEHLVDSSPKGKRVADIGCGSGILGIAAKKLGSQAVVGFDIEPASVVVANENAVQNHTEVTWFVSDNPQSLQKFAKFDIVLSNIISATLMNFAPWIGGIMEERGIWIVSGVIPANWPDVLKAAERGGFELLKKDERDGWVCASLRRK